VYVHYSLTVVTNDESQECPAHNKPSSYAVYKPFQNLPETNDKMFAKCKTYRNEGQISNNCTMYNWAAELQLDN